MVFRVLLVSFFLSTHANALGLVESSAIKAPNNYKMENEILVSGELGLEAKVNKEGITIKLDTENEVVEARIEKTSKTGLESASPSQIRRVLSGVNREGYSLGKYAILQYPAEALGFYMALTAMSIWECMVNAHIPSEAPSNPTIVENHTACTALMQTLKDPVSHVSFAIFIQTNKHTSRMMSRYNEKFKAKYGRSFIPDGLTKYLGLAAGSLVSTLAGEFTTDPNVRYIATNFFKNKNSAEQNRFDRVMDVAYEKWAVSNMTVYGHHVASLLASAVTASFVTSMGTKIFRSLQTVYDRSSGGTIPGSLPVPDSKIAHIGGKTVKRFRFSSFKFPIKAFSRLAGPAAVYIEVGTLLHFFFWKYTVYGPFFKKLLMQEEAGAKLKFYQSEVIKYLAYANQKENVFLSQVKTPVRNFIYDNLHSKEQIDLRETYLQSNSEVCGELVSENRNLEYFNKASNDMLNKNILSAGYQYTKKLCPSFVQLPSLLDNNFTKNLGKVMDITKTVEDTEQTLQEVLLENISKHQETLIHYYKALGDRVRHAYESWQTFFEPYEHNVHTVTSFYSSIVANKGKKLFPDGFDYWKSKGVMDSMFYNIRPLENAVQLTSSRLTWENKLAQLGVAGRIIVQLSNNQLRPIFNILFNMRTTFGGNPSEERKAAIEFLNNGFSPLHLGKFKRYDYQVRNYAINKGLKLEVLDKLDTPTIQRTIDYLESLDPWDVPVYIYALNAGSSVNNLRNRSIESITQSMGGRQSIMLAMASDQMARLSQENMSLVDPSIRFEVKSPIHSETSQTGSVKNGLVFRNNLEEILIQMTCGKAPNEMANLLSQDLGNNQMVRKKHILGPLTFVAPRLLQKNDTICSYRKPGYSYNHIHSEFFDQNQRTMYANLLDYAIQNADLTDQDLIDWWSRIQSRNDIELTRYYEEYMESVQAHIVSAFHSDSYGRFTGGIAGALLNIVKNDRTDPFIRSLRFANGIKNLTDDYVDYYLRIVVLLIPRDKQFLEEMYKFIDAIKELTINSEQYNGAIRDRFSYMEEKIKDDKISNERWSPQYFDSMSDVEWYRLIVSELLKNMSFEFKNQLSLRSDVTEENAEALGQIVDNVINNIDEIIQQKVTFSMMEQVLQTN